MMKWCFDNDRNTFDFSKGTGDYKNRWANESYDFENHILYDGKSLKSIIIGNYLYGYFILKQFLRDINVNKLYSKIKFFLGKKTIRVNEEEVIVKELSKKEFNLTENDVVQVSLIDYEIIKPIVYDQLFSVPQPITNISVYKFKDKEEFIIKGKAILHKVHFKQQ